MSANVLVLFVLIEITDMDMILGHERTLAVIGIWDISGHWQTFADMGQ